MKIFVITANIKLIEKPDWLDDFRNRYDKPYEYHITLKQPCFVEDQAVEDIKNKLNNLFRNLHTQDRVIPLTFNTLKASQDALNKTCIMINTTKDEPIRKLQKQITANLSTYKNYYKPEYQAYEEYFQPHITIARDLNEQAYQAATKELAQEYTCKGLVTEVKLIVVNKFGPTEANDPKNQTVYNL